MTPEAKIELLQKAAHARGLIWMDSDSSGLFLHSLHRKGYPVIFNPLDDDGTAFKLMFDLDIHVSYDLGLNELFFCWFNGEKTERLNLYVGGADKRKIARFGITVAASRMLKEEV